MRLPKQVSSSSLVSHLEKHWDYKFSRQRGSHIILTTEISKHHSLPVPFRSSIGAGLLRGILKQVCDAKNITVEELLEGL